ncbi:MAG: hypothetical protein ACFFB3_15415, partial [Candidatus Hodarchaeota archaeon]
LCPNCGTPYSSEDQYCATCGDLLPSNKTMDTKSWRDLEAEEYSRDIGFLIQADNEVQESFKLTKWPYNTRKSYAVITTQGWLCLVDQFLTKQTAGFPIIEIKGMKMKGKDWPLLLLAFCCVPFFYFVFPIALAVILFFKGLEHKLHFETEFFGPFTIRGNESRLRTFYAHLQRELREKQVRRF